MLQVIFGDDEHTAIDGPYARLLKTRKWIYLSSGASLALSWRLYNELAMEKKLSFIKLPQHILAPAFALAVAYLLLQFIALAIQLLSTYDIVLSERFTFRRADELSQAREKVADAQKQVDGRILAFRSDYKAAFDKREQELLQQYASETDALTRLSTIRKNAERNSTNDENLRTARYDENRQKAAAATKGRALTKLRSDTLAELDPSYDENVALAQAELSNATSAYYALLHEVPSERHGYKIAEVFIDLGRILPPAIVAAFALQQFMTVPS